MTTEAERAVPLPKCTMPGCAIRYRGGPDRPCPMHQDEGGVHQAAADLGIDLPAMIESTPDPSGG